MFNSRLELQISKPCPQCMKILNALGCQIFYSTKGGEIIKHDY